ncbi:magnesium transporter NIPA2 isoform X2 [Pararge aegeria]|uniref:magnesium transporter NIPA2 isoform X2 n=1 Tax=Pararge aegeria TaxID=116150 RepID=UPI0019D1249A|nr:magnesium transporter NIPA2 isoform X2 [Pararge aegeria]
MKTSIDKATEGEDYDRVSFLIGLGLAISSSVFIGSSFIIKKLALKKINSLVGIGEAANLVAYAFAPAALVTPLGALSVLVAAVLSAKFLKENLNTYGKIGCLLCIMGSIIFVVHSPKHEEIKLFSELTSKLSDYIFLTYVFTVLIMTLIVKIVFVPRFGNTSIIVYLLICSAIGSLTVVFCKGVALGIKESINSDKNNIFSYVFWLLLTMSIICIAIQMNYLNKSLDIFNTNIVTPVYYVMFTVLVIIASGILFREWEHMKTYDILGCLCGFLILMVAVFTLNTFKDLSFPYRDLNLNSRHRSSVDT